MESEKMIDRKLNFLGLSSTYWNLVSASIEAMIETNNSYGGIYQKENAATRYKENSKWNSSNIGIPVIYNFYHGFELYIKGIALEYINPGKHNINNLIPYISDKYNNIKLDHLINKYYIETDLSPFPIFFKNYTPSNIHLTLRYPESNPTKDKGPEKYDTSPLYNQWEEGESIFDMGKHELNKFEEIYDDISILNSLKPDLIEKF